MKAYLKNSVNLILVLLLALTGCQDEEEFNAPPEINGSTTRSSLEDIDLDTSVGPTIRGWAIADAGLQQVRIIAVRGDQQEDIFNETSFPDFNGTRYEYSVHPDYASDYTQIRVVVTDRQGRSEELAYDVVVRGGTAGPIMESFTTETLEANVRPTVNIRPNVSGTIRTHLDLKSVTYTRMMGEAEEEMQVITDFGNNSNRYNVAFTPDYEVGMTALKITAMDSRGNTSERIIPTIVIDAAPAPEVTFDQESVSADLLAEPNVTPEVSGTASSIEGINSVSFYRIIGGQDQQIGESVTMFDDPEVYSFTLQPEYEFGMTGIKVTVEDAAGQTVSEVLPVSVVAEDPFLVTYSNIAIFAQGQRSNMPTAFSFIDGSTYVFDQEPATDADIAASIHFIAGQPSNDIASFDIFSPHESWLDNNYYQAVAWPQRNTTLLRILDEGELDFATATSADINALPLGSTTGRARAIQDTASKTVLFETAQGNRGLIFFVGSDGALNKQAQMTFNIKYVND